MILSAVNIRDSMAQSGIQPSLAGPLSASWSLKSDHAMLDQGIAMKPIYLVDPSPLFTHHKLDDDTAAVCCILRSGSVRKSTTSAPARNAGGAPDVPSGETMTSEEQQLLIHTSQASLSFFCSLFGVDKFREFGSVEALVRLYSFSQSPQSGCDELDQVDTDVKPTCSWLCFAFRKALYVQVCTSSMDAMDGSIFKTQLVALLEMAEELVGCDRVIIALPSALSFLIKSFVYVGFELVSSDPSLLRPSHFLYLGYEI